jgi:predicted cation transporter
VPALGLSPLDVLVVLGFGAAGFVVVALVCAAVLAMLQLVLPSQDAGAVQADRLAAAAAEATDEPDGLDAEADA